MVSASPLSHSKQGQLQHPISSGPSPDKYWVISNHGDLRTPLQHIHRKQCMGHGSTFDVLGLQSSHLGAKRELLSFHLSIFIWQQSNLIWPLHLRAVTHGCSTPPQGCYKALISTSTVLQKQPSLPSVQPNLTVTTMRAEGKAGGALIQTMENQPTLNVLLMIRSVQTVNYFLTQSDTSTFDT